MCRGFIYLQSGAKSWKFRFDSVQNHSDFVFTDILTEIFYIFAKKNMENYSHLQKLTGWSDAIFEAIGSEAEARIYIKAGLIEKRVNGRPALTNPTIVGEAFNCRKEWLKTYLADYDSWKDWNNADLMGEGFPPRDDNGDPYELHHIGQRQDSPFAELTYWQHMTDGNNAILHPKRESEIDRRLFEKEKADHWKARFNDFKDCY